MNERKAWEQLRTTVKEHAEIVNQICDLLTQHKVPPATGEVLMLYIAGLSAGIRQAPITGDWTRPAAMAWQYGADYGDNAS